MGESTIDIQCWFIHGSDALGYKVVLVSDCPNISDVHVNLSRSYMSASGQLTTFPAIRECLRLTSMSTTLSVIWLLREVKATADCVYIVHSKFYHSFMQFTVITYGLLLLSGQKNLPITVPITTTLIIILLIITVLAVIITFAIRQHNKKSKTYLLSDCVSTKLR